MRFVRLKCVQKIVYDLTNNRGDPPPFNVSIIIIFVFVLISFICWFFLSSSSSTVSSKTKYCAYTFDRIDVVYTWVNGSDPQFIQEIQQYTKHFNPARFMDKNELKYSLRSLAKYAPWINHIYIVTNGQIPHWLNLDHEQITVFSHMDLVRLTTDDPSEVLPTFNSAAIETFLHLIPNLSRQFLYLNDDIFLGMPIYPDDFYTHSGGVTVFTAWNVPDCAQDCPWIYIGDGACDETCNIERCQFDGGDCDDVSNEPSPSSTIIAEPSLKNLEDYPTFVDIAKVHKQNSSTANKNDDFLSKITIRTSDQIKDKVEVFNEELRQKIVLKRRLRRLENSKRTSTTKFNKRNVGASDDVEDAHTKQDIYAQSLITTNRLFNQLYGFKQRKVIGHVGFLLNTEIVTEMLATYADHFRQTRQHRFRHSDDMQFAFSYYHHMMEQRIERTISEIFDEFDTDKSGSWSDREIRTLLTHLYSLPLSWTSIEHFQQIVTNCSVLFKEASRAIGTKNHLAMPYPTLHYERYLDSNIPTISKEMVMECIDLVEMLNKTFGSRPKYRFTLNIKSVMHSNFKMLTSNVSQVVEGLDHLRLSRKKFNCINDNLDHALIENNDLIIGLLEDFYLSLFPAKSPYELDDNVRNRFTNLTEYRHWKLFRNCVCLIAFVAVLLSIILAAFSRFFISSSRRKRYLV